MSKSLAGFKAQPNYLQFLNLLYLVVLCKPLGNFRSEYEYDYEYEFSVLSTRSLKNVDLET